MEPCSSCSRHLRATETHCPFCGAAQHRGRAPLAHGLCALVATVMLSACSTAPEADPDGGTTTSPSTTSTESSTTGDDATETSTGTTDGNSTTNDEESFNASFYAGSSDSDDWNEIECDPFVQDCPEGEKCVPQSAGGPHWEEAWCVPILGEGVTGEACTSTGPVTSEDSCDGHNLCWDLRLQDGEYVGECMPFCTGAADYWECPGDTTCVFANSGSVAVCSPTCDPLLQDCDEGEMCAWYGSITQNFACTVTTATSDVGEVCSFANDCPIGSLCLSAEVLLDCEGDSCCTELCSLEMPEPCANPGHECVPFLDDGNAPPQFLDDGICAIPEGCPDVCTELVVSDVISAP